MRSCNVLTRLFFLWWQGGAGEEVPDIGQGPMSSLEVEGDWDIASTRVLTEVLHSQSILKVPLHGECTRGALT